MTVGSVCSSVYSEFAITQQVKSSWIRYQDQNQHCNNQTNTNDQHQSAPWHHEEKEPLKEEIQVLHVKCPFSVYKVAILVKVIILHQG